MIKAISFDFVAKDSQMNFRHKDTIRKILFIRGELLFKGTLKYNTKVTAIKPVHSLMVLLTLATLIMAATSFQTTLAQPMTGDSNMGMGNGGDSGMNFNPMSFANNLSNASSLYGSVGISMVNGVKVTSISLLENNEIAVTLRHSPAADTSNNISATTMSSAAATLPPRVTVTAIRVPMNLKDLMSLASSQSSKMMTGNMSTTMSNPMMMGGGGPLQGYGGAAAAGNGTNNFNPLSFLTGLQIGSSSTVANADWTSSQIARMGLTDMMGSTNNNNASASSTADFVIVSVIPYTGKSTTTSPVG